MMSLTFDKIWKKRKKIKINTKTWEPYRGWETENKQHLVLLIRILNKKIIKHIEDLQEELKKSKCYVEFPKEYYHITLKSIGFLDNSKLNHNSYSDKELRIIIRDVERKLKNKARFKIKLGPVNLFKDVVFIEVHDNNKFSLLNKDIIKIKNIQRLKRDYPNFIPHMSVGTFKNNRIYPLIKILEKNRDINLSKTYINRIDLVIARWHKTRFPYFKVLKSFKLKKNQ